VEGGSGPWPETKAVLYFGTGVARGLESPRDSRQLASACTGNNMLFYLVDVLLP
jgi:hypothetical protein